MPITQPTAIIDPLHSSDLNEETQFVGTLHKVHEDSVQDVMERYDS